VDSLQVYSMAVVRQHQQQRRSTGSWERRCLVCTCGVVLCWSVVGLLLGAASRHLTLDPRPRTRDGQPAGRRPESSEAHPKRKGDSEASQPLVRRYALRVRPRISVYFGGAASLDIGDFFEKPGGDRIGTYRDDLLRSTDPRAHRAVALCDAYVRSAVQDVFGTIIARTYLATYTERPELATVRCAGVLVDDALGYVFDVVEPRPGVLDDAGMDELREQILLGGDSWDCGDFGDVTLAIATYYGFRDEWSAAWRGLGFDPALVKIRLSLTDDNPSWTREESVPAGFVESVAAPSSGLSLASQDVPLAVKMRLWSQRSS